MKTVFRHQQVVKRYQDEAEERDVVADAKVFLVVLTSDMAAGGMKRGELDKIYNEIADNAYGWTGQRERKLRRSAPRRK